MQLSTSCPTYPACVSVLQSQMAMGMERLLQIVLNFFTHKNVVSSFETSQKSKHDFTLTA